jgi:hypothetical protein
MAKTAEDLDDLDRAIALSLQEHENNFHSSSGRSPPGARDPTRSFNSQELAFFTSQPLPPPSQAPHQQMEMKPSFHQDNDSEEKQRRKIQSQLEMDAKFAQELEQREKEARKNSQKQRNENANNGNSMRSIFPLPFLNNSSSTGCQGCGKTIHGRYLIVKEGTKYHPQCFCCFGCGQPLESKYISRESGSRSGSTGEEVMEYYHERCYEELFSKKCDICSKNLIGEYRTHSFFRGLQNYCREHDGQTRQCFSCALKEPMGDQFPSLPDGRVICWRCIDTVVVDSDEARPLYLEAVNFMETILDLPIPKFMREVPVLAVDLSSLNEQNNLKATTCGSVHPNCPSDSNRFGNAGTFSGSTTRGLTLTTVSTVRYISHDNLLWGDFFRHSRNHETTDQQSNGRSLNFPTVHLERRCDVTAVLVLCGLPRDLTTSILAHEAMHVWCKLREVRGKPAPLLDLPPPVEEGLCQYVAYRYLDHLQEINESKTRNETAMVASAPQSWQEKLIPYFKFQIEGDPSPVYGDGFRRAASCCSMIGFEYALEHVTQHQNFPEV